MQNEIETANLCISYNLSSLLTAEEELLMLISKTTLIFIANTLLMLLCSNLLYSLSLKWIFTFFFYSLVSIYQRASSTRDFIFIRPEAVTRRCSVKQVFLESSQNSQENTCARVSFSIKLQASGDSGTGVFLWILRNFLEHLFLQNTSSDCFCKTIFSGLFLFHKTPWEHSLSLSVLQKWKFSELCWNFSIFF